jgi:hypothetical protein
MNYTLNTGGNSENTRNLWECTEKGEYVFSIECNPRAVSDLQKNDYEKGVKENHARV